MTAENHKIRLPETHEYLLRSTALAHIATLGPNGEHGKFSQTKTRQKHRNINREPRLALSIVDPDNPFRYLEVRGVVERIEEDPDLDFINSMAKKYLGMDKYPNHRPGDERIVLFVRPEHTTKMGS